MSGPVTLVFLLHCDVKQFVACSAGGSCVLDPEFWCDEDVGGGPRVAAAARLGRPLLARFLHVLLRLLTEDVHLVLVEAAVAAEHVRVAAVREFNELRVAARLLAPFAHLHTYTRCGLTV